MDSNSDTVESVKKYITELMAEHSQKVDVKSIVEINITLKRAASREDRHTIYELMKSAYKKFPDVDMDLNVLTPEVF